MPPFTTLYPTNSPPVPNLPYEFKSDASKPITQSPQPEPREQPLLVPTETSQNNGNMAVAHMWEKLQELT